MKGCRRPPTIRMPLIAPKQQADAGRHDQHARGRRTWCPPAEAGTQSSDRKTAPKASGRIRRRASRSRLLRALAGGRRAPSPDCAKTKRTTPRPIRATIATGHRQAHDRRPACARHGQKHGADDRADRHQRADRKVDAAGDDDRRHAGGDQPGDRHLAQHVEQVAVGEEDVVAPSSDRREEHADQEDQR